MRSISVMSFFFCPHHTISKGCAAFHTSFGQLGYPVLRSQTLSWQGKDICGKSVCVELSCSEMVGQIPMIVVLFKGKGKSVSPQSTCFAQADMHVLKA